MQKMKGCGKLADFKIRLETEVNESNAKKQLQDLISSIEKDPIDLKVNTSNVKSELSEIIKLLKQVNTTSQNKNSTPNKSISNTLAQFKQLTNQYNSLQRQLSKETNVKSVGVLKKQLTEVGTAITNVRGKLNPLEKELAKTFSTTSTQKLEAGLSKTFSSLESKASKLSAEIKSAFNNPNMDSGMLNSLQTRMTGLQNLFKNFDMSKLSGGSLNKLATEIDNISNKLKQVNTSANQVKLENKFQVDCSKAISQLEKLKSVYEKLGKNTSGIDKLANETKQLQNSIGNVNLGKLQTGLSGVNKQIASMKSSTSTLKGVGNSVKSTFGQIASSFTMLAPGYMIGSGLVSGISSLKSEILELDKSMTNLKKVADTSQINTEAKIQGITNSAIELAKSTGSSVSSVVESMAEAMKLGAKGIDGAEQVAKYAQVFSNIGDIDVSSATQGIAQIMNAFKVDPLKKMSVAVNGVKKETTELSNAMDILNFADNNYAISMDGILQALQNGGSTMAAYGMSIQETTAMITASNMSIQDPARVGNGLKSIAVNLAGLKTSAKDGSISLNKTAVALKGIAGIDIFTDETKTDVKSMPKLMDEVSKKWDSLNGTQQKALSNAIAGKTQSAVFSSLMQNYEQYKSLMKSYNLGEQFGSADKENARYIDSISGRLAKLKATWAGIATTVFNSSTIKSGVSGFNSFSEGIAKVISTIDKLKLGAISAVAGVYLLKTAFSSFKYAKSLSGGIAMFGMELASLPGRITGTVEKVALALSAFTGLNVTMLGLAGTIGVVALAFGGIALAIKAVNDANTKATRKYDEVTKSLNKHKKAVADAKNQEDGLTSKLEKYQKLSEVTNKTKKQQEEYNQVLKDLAKIDPNLVTYDDKGNPIKARVGEVKDLIEEYKKAQREQQNLLNIDLKDKADTSIDKYKEQDSQRKKELLKLEKLKNDLLYNKNPKTGAQESKLGDDGGWLARLLAGDEQTKTFVNKYFSDLQKYKDEEKKFIDSVTKQRKSVSKDQSDWLGNLFSENEDLEKAGKKRKQALDNALKLDFSQFDKKGMNDLGVRLNEWFTNTDYKNTGTFNKQIEEVNKLNEAWKNGDITSRTYKNSVNEIASALSKLTGGEISTEEFAKMLKMPEFDVESAHKTFSDLDEAKQTLEEKIKNMGLVETPKQRLKMAYDIIQDEKVPLEIKDKIAEFASDGKITDEELEIMLNLVGNLNDDDLENTVNEKIEKLSEKKEVTQEVAIEYAMEVKGGSDFNQYLEAITGDSGVAVDIQIHMETGDLEMLKEDLKGIPVEKQVGIIVSAVNSGNYTPEQLQGFIQLLPNEKQVDIINTIQQSGSMSPEQLKQLIDGLPPEVQKKIKVSTPGADGANSKLGKVDKNSKNKNKQVKTSAPGADNTISKEKQVDKNSKNKNKQVKTSAPGASSTANILRDVNTYSKSKTFTITTVFKQIGKAVTGFFGGGYQPPGGKNFSVSQFSNISDTPQEVESLSLNKSIAPVQSMATDSATPDSYSSSGEVSTMAKTDPIDTVYINPTKATTIIASYNNVWNSIKNGINLFQELENRIKKVSNNVDLLNAKMEKASSSQKITYLQQQNKLYKEQATLTNTLYKSLMEQRTQLEKKAKTYGFTINSQGNMTTYEGTLLKLSREAEKAEKKASDYKGKNEKTKTSLEKSAEKAKKKLEEAKSVSDAFLNLQNTEIPNARVEWQKLQNTIKETNDEIEQLKFEQQMYKEKNAIDELNHSIKQYSHYRDRLSTKADRYEGETRIKYMKEEAEHLKKLQELNENLHDQYVSQRKDYKGKLKSFGATFETGTGQISNYDEILNKYQNSADLAKIKKWMEEYQDILDSERDTNDLRQKYINEMQDLQNDIRKLQLEVSLDPYITSLDIINSKIKKLQNNLDIIGIKMENAYGSDKLNLIKEQIALYEQLQKEQQNVLENAKNQEKILKDELERNGFNFDSNGNINNLEDAMAGLKDSGAYEYLKSVLEQWKKLHEDEIPDAIKDIANFDKAIKDAYNEQLNITKEIEGKISDMIKKQIEDRKSAIQKETETVKTELEKQKKAYQDMRAEVDYNKDYDEKSQNVTDLERKLEIAKKDSSLGNKKKIADLEKELADAKKDLDDFVQNKIDDDIIKGYDNEIDAIEDKNNKAIEQLEEMWTDSKIAEAIQKALSTGLFEGIDGQVSNLQDAMLDFATTSGDALGVMGDSIKNNLIANLNIALDTLKNYSDIANNLGFNNIDPTSSNNRVASKSVNTGDISVNINIPNKPNISEHDIENAVKKAINEALSGTVEGM